MFQTLSVAFAQVKAGNTLDSLSNKVMKIVQSFYREKEITKNCIIIKLNQYKYKMDTIFMN